MTDLAGFKTHLEPGSVLGERLDYDLVAVNAPVGTAAQVSKFVELVGDKITLMNKVDHVKANVDDLYWWLQIATNPWVLRLPVKHLSNADVIIFKKRLCRQLSKMGHFCLPHSDIRVS